MKPRGIWAQAPQHLGSEARYPRAITSAFLQWFYRDMSRLSGVPGQPSGSTAQTPGGGGGGVSSLRQLAQSSPSQRRNASGYLCSERPGPQQGIGTEYKSSCALEAGELGPPRHPITQCWGPAANTKSAPPGVILTEAAVAPSRSLTGPRNNCEKQYREPATVHSPGSGSGWQFPFQGISLG